MNTDIIIPQNLGDIDKLIYLVRVSDRADSLTREGLHKVFIEEGWKGRFSSWGEFVSSPDGLNKSESWASKHLAIYKHYVLEGGLSQAKLESAATESLYLARLLPGSVIEQLSAASTLSRNELRLEKNDADPHEPEYDTICTICHVYQGNHN